MNTSCATRRIARVAQTTVILIVSCFVTAMSVAPAWTVTRSRSAAPIAGTRRRLASASETWHSNATSNLGQFTAAQRAVVNGRVLVGDAARYAQSKAEAERAVRAPSAAPPAASTAKAPTTLRNFQGQNDLNFAPSDSTASIGTQRFIELVNSKVGIYDRTNNTPIAADTLNTLTGSGVGPQVFDPQIMWDPDTNRFYYATGIIVDALHNFLAFGFSTTDSPSNATTDWCKFSVAYGAELPDFPKLGDLTGLALIGVNVFNGNAFTRSDVAAITKPASGTTCPAASSLTLSIVRDLRNADGSQSTTPLPANQVDGNTTGHVIAGKGFNGGNVISVFNATKNASNQLVLGAARAMSVAAFSVPPAAPQPGTARKLETLDARLTNAVEAIDPNRSNQVAIWTQHTVAGGAGSAVRWYEINPAPTTPVPFQSGTQTNGSLFLFNAAISPDRRRNGATGQFGNGMVLHYSRSSSSAPISIAAVSKVNDGNVTGETVVFTSTAVIDDFSCDATNVCRWGDYAGASPDPASDATASNGVVWGVNGWAQASAGTSADWRTQNFALRASPK